MTTNDTNDTKDVRTHLEAERALIERQLVEHGAAVEGEGVEVEVDDGFADSAQATAERSELVGQIEQLHATHRAVLKALEKIDLGTYGKCESCGRPIPKERLEALPEATLCVACKQKK